MPSNKGYSKKVLRNFLNPKNFGKIKNPDAVGKVGNPTCGDIMWMYLKIDKKTEKIKEIKFKTYGCAAAIASTEQLTILAKGKTLKEAEKINMKDVASALEGLPQIKLHCSTMAIQALKKSIEEYRNKKSKNGK